MGKMKVASQSGKKEAILDYWFGDDAACTKDEFLRFRPWKLHVYKFAKTGHMTKQNREKLTSLFQRGEWILDIDEDYLSTNNPHGIEFRQFFGEESYKTLAEVYDIEVKEYYNYWKSLEKIAKETIFKKSKQSYLKNEVVQEMIRNLLTAISQKEAEKAALEYQKVC